MRIIGLLTEDPRTYFDMLGALRGRGLKFVALDFSDSIPPEVGAVITTEEERHKIGFDKIITEVDPDIAIAKATAMLANDSDVKELAIGVDPGVRPGFAVLADGVVLVRDIAESPEAVRPMVGDITREYPTADVVVRIGHGDKTNRNRILNALWDDGYKVEIVDESNTTKRSHTPDEDAAVEIAMTPGYKPGKRQESEPCDGEIRNIQRLSRIESAGSVTISKDLAMRIAKGELSMREAIQLQKNGQT
jgi:hypothetical protein